MLCGLLASTASANIRGRVYCIDDSGNHVGIPGVTVTSDCSTPGSVTTDINGNYIFPNAVSGTCHVCVDISTLPPTCEVGPSECLEITVTDTEENNGVDFSFTGCCSNPPPPPCVTCVDPALGLGAAAGCTVLELGAAKVSITGPAGGILGDVCIAPNGSLAISGDEFITGIVNLGAGAKFANSSHSSVTVAQNVDLSAEINAAYATAANAASLPCTQIYQKLTGNNTITGGVGLNVICVGDIVLAGKQITITGPVGAKFIFNVAGKFVLTGGGAGPQIVVAGGVESKDVLYNIIGAGADVAFSGGGGGVNCCAAVVDGTILAPNRKIALSPGLVNGQIISGKDISIVSGSSVRCPPCP